MIKKTKILFIILALSVFLNAFNAFSYCDPKVRIKEIEQSAKNIVNGKCVLVENVYETTRFLKANVIKNMNRDLDTVLIGSSNMLPYLNKDNTKKFLNLSIGGANLQERLNVLGLLSAYGIKYKNRVMVCLDTCHISDAGYDLNDFDKVLLEFDSVIGLEKLGCIHVNDSKNECGAHKDRHDNIGFGHIGFDNLIKIIYHDKLKELPKILETPYVKENPKDKISYPPYKEEIEMIRAKRFNDRLISEIISHNK